MPLFVIERNFAEQLDLDAETAQEIARVNADVGIRWFLSFLSADKKKTYCIYEAASADAIRRAAERLGLPTDAIIEVSELDPAGYAGGPPSPLPWRAGA